MTVIETRKENFKEIRKPFLRNKGSQERNFKGKHIMGISDNYVVIDIETTGLDFSCDEIIELAAAKVENGIIVNNFTALIKPEQKVNDFIVELTGITNKMLESAPRAEMVLQEFVAFVGSELIIGHNVNFDINFIYDICQEKIGYNFSNDFLDTLKLSRILFANEKQHKLTDLINRFGIGQVVEHRALGDVLQTQKCYEYMLGYAADNGFELKYLQNNNMKKKLKASINYMDSLFGE